MESILYPAYQKLYSALSSLDRFRKENSFFDNISSLDTFFSEFRNVTFVLQKSIAHTEFKKDYEELRDKYLSDCKWFIEKRNDTIKQEPFQLIKEIKLTIYHPWSKFEVDSFKFSIENDVKMSTFLDKFKALFLEVNPYEVFFSAFFVFYEKNKKDDIYDKLVFGVKQISLLLGELKNRINQSCDICLELEKKLRDFHFGITLKDMIFVNDYVYYPKTDMFERAERIAFSTRDIDVSFPRTPINTGRWHKFGNSNTSMFEKFIITNISIGTVDLMPTRMIIYDDDTYEMDTYHSTIKTTIYRKINDTAQKIINDNIKEVYFMQVYTFTPQEFLSTTTSVERKEYAQEDILVFMKMDSDLNEEEYCFTEREISSQDNVMCAFRLNKKQKLDIGLFNMLPVIEAFKKKRNRKCQKK